VAIRKLRKLQYGFEATKGTPVAATGIWRVAGGVIEDQREVVFPKEDVGTYPQLDRSYTPKHLAAIEVDDSELTFEEGPLPFALGIDDVVTGVADGAGTGKLYDYVLGISTDPGFKTGTLEAGDDFEVEEMEHSFAAQITLKGAAGEAWMYSASLVGRRATVSSFTAALALVSVEEVLFSRTKLYIDAGGGTIGTTLKSSTLLASEVTIKTGLQPVFTADGELYFTFAKRTEPEVVMKITFEHDGTASAEKTAWRNQTVRLIQLLCEGSTLGTPGAYTKKTFRVRLAGKWEKFDKLDEKDGNDVVQGTFRALYSSADALYAQFLFVNQRAAL